ncbi:MAG: methionine adenosyltransferase [Bacteroidota bacterium]|nr:methionine adenosyltransferase [Bacteroidota bacterium]MDW8138432.1 methionine adenosyltransferase [Bacteroidota bacterium]
MPHLFTSESVSEGHPDKIADQISDAILDAMLEQDPHARVAVETLVTTGLVFIAGEVTTRAQVDIDGVVRTVIEGIGYTRSEYRFEAHSCAVLTALKKQSPDIARGVDRGGAGDQGMMFGYACRETPVYMPAPIYYAHRLLQELARIRKNSLEMPYLRPDAKSQVTIEYDDQGRPRRVHTIVLSTQHDPSVDQKRIEEDVRTILIPRVIPPELLDEHLTLYVNPTGQFVIGGPHGDTGLTGRKIVVDTYGGRAPHGGGAFSGKDPTKVDRSGAYAARHIAKNVVAAGLADECLVQIAYAIGLPKPVSVYVNTHGTGRIPDHQLTAIINRLFDLTPRGIIERFRLLRPIYRQTAVYGHFGREEFPWEALDAVELLQQEAEKVHQLGHRSAVRT